MYSLFFIFWNDTARPMQEWHDIVSQRIEDAMRNGMFDNLPARGKPLKEQRKPHVPEDQRIAVTILLNNNLTPEWITERAAIQRAIEDMRVQLAEQIQAIDANQTSSEETNLFTPIDSSTQWILRWKPRISTLNDRILLYNLNNPVAHLEIIQLQLDDELMRARAATDLNRSR